MQIKSELEKLCFEISGYPMDWEETDQRVFNNYDTNNTFNLTQLIQAFTELHLDVVIDKIKNRFPELHIITKPISEGAETEDLFFSYDTGGRIKAKKKYHNVGFEYDDVILVDKLPVVLEMKSGAWNHENNQGTIEQALSPTYYNFHLYPIRKLFNSDVGYVVLVPLDVYKNNHSKSKVKTVKRFEKDNGILVPLWTDRYNIRSQIYEHLTKLDLTLKSA
jgi:hypothetical protein